jgi:hypothetical protein
MKTESQKEMILNDLLTGIKITGLDALKNYGCLNLRNRICEIGSEYPVERKLIAIKTKYGNKHVMQYWINNPKRLK